MGLLFYTAPCWSYALSHKDGHIWEKRHFEKFSASIDFKGVFKTSKSVFYIIIKIDVFK